MAATEPPPRLSAIGHEPGWRLDLAEGRLSLLLGDWRVVAVGAQRLDPGAGVTIGFAADGRLTGQGPCAALAGGWALSGEGLSMRPAAAALPACPEPLLQIEARWRALLAASYRFEIGADGELALVAADSRVVARRP